MAVFNRQFGKSYANLTTKSGRRGQWNGLPYHDDSESHSMYLIYIFILCFVISTFFAHFFATCLTEDFIPSALGRQSDFGHCCLARRAASRKPSGSPLEALCDYPTDPNGSQRFPLGKSQPVLIGMFIVIYRMG